MNEKVGSIALQAGDIVLAAWADHTEAVRSLLKRGVDANAPPGERSSLRQQKVTALHFAARYCNTAIMGALIEHGANVNVPNDVGNTPLHEALDKNSNEGSAVAKVITAVRLLLDHGADIRASGGNGDSA